MGRPLRLEEVRGFEYVEVDREQLGKLDADLTSVFKTTLDVNLKLYPGHTPVAPCVRCGTLAIDPVRDLDHERYVDAHLLSEEEQQAVCESCIEAEKDARVVALLESKLGLSEKDRDALRSFIETVFTDPAKILQVKDLDNRVRSLERQNVIMWGIVGVLVAAVIALTALLVSVVAA